jgi:mannose-6-phosphate isomerase-like protein (cupin superfamily)
VVDTGLHSHENLDGFWFVLSGRARFYTTGDKALAGCRTP